MGVLPERRGAVVVLGPSPRADNAKRSTGEQLLKKLEVDNPVRGHRRERGVLPA